MSSLSALGKLGAAAGVFAVVALASEYEQGPLFPAHAAEGGAIPAEYRASYRDAADACGELDWALLAGIGKVETDHGRSDMPGVHAGSNAAGAAGPMQFLPSTFATVRSRHPEVGPDIYDPADSIEAAAQYLCDSGLDTGDEYAAVFAYNHADWYVDKVRARAATYRGAA